MMSEHYPHASYAVLQDDIIPQPFNLYDELNAISKHHAGKDGCHHAVMIAMYCLHLTLQGASEVQYLQTWSIVYLNLFRCFAKTLE